MTLPHGRGTVYEHDSFWRNERQVEQSIDSRAPPSLLETGSLDLRQEMQYWGREVALNPECCPETVLLPIQTLDKKKSCSQFISSSQPLKEMFYAPFSPVPLIPLSFIDWDNQFFLLPVS